MQHNTVPYSTVLCSAAQYSTVQCSAVQYSPVACCSAEAAGGLSDFEVMLARKRDERRGRRRRRDIDIINDNDDLIAQLLQSMRQAADEDRELNRKNQPAVKKVNLQMICNIY